MKTSDHLGTATGVTKQQGSQICPWGEGGDQNQSQKSCSSGDSTYNNDSVGQINKQTVMTCFCCPELAKVICLQLIGWLIYEKLQSFFAWSRICIRRTPTTQTSEQLFLSFKRHRTACALNMSCFLDLRGLCNHSWSMMSQDTTVTVTNPDTDGNVGGKCPLYVFRKQILQTSVKLHLLWTKAARRKTKLG